MGLSIFAGLVFLVRRSKSRRGFARGPDEAADHPAHISTVANAKLNATAWAELDAGNSPAELR